MSDIVTGITIILGGLIIIAGFAWNIRDSFYHTKK